MANYTIRYSCGHSAEKQLFGKHADRDRYIAWAADNGQCEACRKQDKILACEAVEVEHELPQLSGSEKQIAWARTIRAEKIVEIVAYVETARPKVPADKIEQFETELAVMMQVVCGKTSASWWIDHRIDTGRTIALAAFKEARK